MCTSGFKIYSRAEVPLVNYHGSGVNVVRTAGRLIKTDSLRSLVNRGDLIAIDGGL